MMEVEERTASTMAKLELVKEIKSKTLQMLQMKEQLLDEVENCRKEERFLQDYRSEMELLMQEKMAHVEELRQIHADINAMESLIKQTEQARSRSIDAAKRLHQDFGPVKAEVDRLRQACLGLERLPELHEEEPSIISSELFDQIPTWSHPHPPAQREEVMQGHQGMSYPQHQHQQPSTPQQAAAAFIMSQNPLAMMQSAAAAKQQQDRPPPPHLPQHTGPTPPFRQQPPPMKSCLSCHQQIHRNAPICPLCKAKSRSRNPKKPKKKE